MLFFIVTEFTLQQLLLTNPLLNGRLFCVHLMSVSGMEPSTWHDILYNSPEDKSFGLYVIFTLVGFTEMRKSHFEVFYNVSITTFPLFYFGDWMR